MRLICSDHIERMTALGPRSQALHVFEGAGGMRADAALRVKNTGLGKGQGGGAVDQASFGDQFATCSLHETGFHFNGDHTHLLRDAACGNRHGHIQQRHTGTAVGDIEGVEVFRFRLKVDLRKTTLEQLELKTQVVHEGNVNTKLDRLLFSQFSPL